MSAGKGHSATCKCLPFNNTHPPPPTKQIFARGILDSACMSICLCVHLYFHVLVCVQISNFVSRTPPEFCCYCIESFLIHSSYSEVVQDTVF